MRVRKAEGRCGLVAPRHAIHVLSVGLRRELKRSYASAHGCIHWSQLRGFLETADTQWLLAAAYKLDPSQPMLSRVAAVIESQFGVTLLERMGKAMTRTGIGLALLEHAWGKGAAAEYLRIAATEQLHAMDVIVCDLASETVAACRPTEVLRSLRRQAPGVVDDLVTCTALIALCRHEAEIDISLLRSDQPDLIGHRPRDASACLLCFQSLSAAERPAARSAGRGAAWSASIERAALAVPVPARAAAGCQQLRLLCRENPAKLAARAPSGEGRPAPRTAHRAADPARMRTAGRGAAAVGYAERDVGHLRDGGPAALGDDAHGHL